MGAQFRDPELQALFDKLKTQNKSSIGLRVKSQAAVKPQTKLTLGNWKPLAESATDPSDTDNDGKPGGNRFKGAFSRVIDILSRGNYASAEAFRRATDPTDDDDGWNFSGATAGFFKGLSGKKKTTFSDVLKQNGHTGRGMGTLAFGLDVFADPTTYLGVGLVSKAAKGADEGLEAAETLTRGQRASRIAEAAKPDIVQLGESAGKFVKRKVTGGSKASPTDISLGRQTAAAANLAELLAKVGNVEVGRIAQPSSTELDSNVASVVGKILAKTSKPLTTPNSVKAPKVTPTPVEALSVPKAAPEPLYGAALPAVPKKIDVSILPARSADEAARLRPIIEDLTPGAVGKGVTNAKGAVPLDEMPEDVIAGIKYDARKRADAWFDKMGVRADTGKTRNTKTGPVAVTKLDGQSMADLRREAAREKAAGGGSNMRTIVGEDTYHTGSEGVSLNLSRAAHLKAIESSPEYIEAMNGFMKLAIKAHNRGLPKAKKNADVVQRTLAQIPEYRGSGAAPQVDEVAAPAVAAPVEVATDISKRITEISGGRSVKQLEAEVRKIKGNGPLERDARKELRGMIKDLKAAEIELKNLPDEAKAITPAEEIIATAPPVGVPATPAARMQAAAAEMSASQIKDADAAAKKAWQMMDANSEAFKNLNASMKAIPHTKFTAVKQQNLWSNIFESFTVSRGYKKGQNRTALLNDPEHLEVVKRAYVYAEALIEGLGKTARVSMKDATPLRLSAMLDQLEPTDLVRGGTHVGQILRGEIDDPRLLQIREQAIAGAHISDVKAAEESIEAGIEALDGTAKMPDVIAEEVIKATPTAVKKSAQNAGASPVAIATASKIIQEAVDAVKKDRGPIFAAQMQVAKQLEEAAVTAVPNPAAIAHVTRATDKYLGIHFNGKPVITAINFSAISRGVGTVGRDKGLGKFFDAMNKTEDWFAIRFNTAFGMGRPLLELHREGANNAAQRSMSAINAWQDIFRPYGNPEAAADAFRLSQDTGEGPIADRIKEMLEVATRNGIPFDEINRAVARLYPAQPKGLPSKVPQFATKVTDKLGREQVLKDPFDAWQAWDIKAGENIAHQLWKIQTAIDHSVVDNLTLQNAAARFGSMIPTAEHGLTVPGASIDSRLKGHFFHKDDAANLKFMLKKMNEIRERPSDIARFYDRAMGVWKTQATKLNPSHHVRNGIGDAYMNFLDGVKSPYGYNDARKILSMRMPEVMADALKSFQPVAGSEVLFKHPKFGEITTDKAWAAMNEFGLRQMFAVSDNLEDVNLWKAPNRFMQGVNAASDYNTMYFRAAHFMDLLRKSKQPTLEAASREAAARVQKFHGDYGDLTDFERKYMKRIMPFYTWMRKVSPVLIESALLRPGKVMVYNKLQHQIAEHFGLNSDDNSYFPQVDQLVPEWMQDAAQVPYFTSDTGNVVMGDPSNPFNDQLSMLNKPGESIGGMLGPIPKILLETQVRKTDDQPNGRTFFGDIPIKDKSEYYADQVPLLSTFTRLTRRDPLNGFQPRPLKNEYEDDRSANVFGIINWLTAGGLQENTTRRQMGAEVAAKVKASQEKRNAKPRDEK